MSHNILIRYPDLFVRLYFTTQSVDHIFIVMEYVPVCIPESGASREVSDMLY